MNRPWSGWLAFLLLPALVIPAPAASSGKARASRAPISRASAPPAPGAAALDQRLGAVVSRSCLRGPRAGVVVGALDDGRIVFERNARMPLAPASTMKILTTAAVLDRLGPDFRFETSFYADGPIEQGVLHGNLYVRGSGAPDLVSERLPELAAGLIATGLRQVTGDFIGDESYFDAELRAPGWPSSANTNPYNAPISALAINFNTVRVDIMPSAPGTKALVSLDPASDLIRLDNRTRMGKRTSLSIRRTFDGTWNTLSVRGTVSARSGWRSEWMAIEDPSRTAASVIERSLEDSGIAIDGQARLGFVPSQATPIYSFLSKPLAEIVADANKNSSNFITECLHRTLGAVAYGPPGTREKGARAVSDFLTSIGLSEEGLTLADGSGLSDANRVTARTLLAVLMHVIDDPRIGANFVASLPIGGIDGTMRNRLMDVPGRVRAKTGSIAGARALAGYVYDGAGSPVYAFAGIANRYRCPDGQAVGALDRIARVLVNDAALRPGTNSLTLAPAEADRPARAARSAEITEAVVRHAVRGRTILDFPARIGP